MRMEIATTSRIYPQSMAIGKVVKSSTHDFSPNLWQEGFEMLGI